jgi:hypothetical protein
MSLHALTISYDVLTAIGIAMVFLWLRLTGLRVRKLGAHAVLTVTGHLRPRPDPSAEQALRTAFAELDRDLAEILGDRADRGAADR